MHTQPPLPIRVVTHNIRYAKTPPLFPGESPWRERCPGLIAELRLATAHHPAPLIFLQEVLHPQLLDILEGLNPASGSSPAVSPNSAPSPSSPYLPPLPSPTRHTPFAQVAAPPHPPTWSHLGVGRDDGFTSGEYSPILFQPSLFAVTLSTTRWLSADPLVPGSKYPGAGSPRLATVARLTHRASGFEFLAICTHLDDQSAAARLFAANALLGYADRFGLVQPPDPDEDPVPSSGGGGAASGGRKAAATRKLARDAYRMPVVLAGDLNSQPHQEAYLALTRASRDKGDAAAADAVGPLADVWASVPPAGAGGYCFGGPDTFTGFEGAAEERARIDFVFARPVPAAELRHKDRSPFRAVGLRPGRDRSRDRRDRAEARGRWDLEGAAVLPNVFDDGVYVSDHRAVVADLLLRRD